MTDAQTRKAVLAWMPQARYINLSNPLYGASHCIDDAYNDRYLAIGEKSRKAAWRAVYRKMLEDRP